MPRMETAEPQTEPVPLAIAKRRARNRTSQRTFRERKARYVKELEKKVAQISQSESVRLQTAQQEVQRLREALSSSKTRILSLAAALTEAATKIGDCLDLQDGEMIGSPQSLNSQNDHSDERDADEADEDEGSEEIPHVAASSQQVIPNADAGTKLVSGNVLSHDLSPGNRNFDEAFGFDLVNHTRLSPSALHSSSWNLTIEDFQGAKEDFYTKWAITTADSTIPEAFSEPSSSHSGLFLPQPANVPASPADNFPPGLATFPSVFAAHISVCEFFIRQNQAYKDRHKPGGQESFHKLLARTVDLIVSTAWPEMRIWWAYIQSSKVVEKIMRWKFDPSVETYRSLPVSHRPTALQMCTSHPAIIDWVFFPSIRDRMIELYSHSWMLDEILCKLVAAYVVEADLSKIIAGMEDQPPQKGFFRIWDIVHTITRSEDAGQEATAVWGEGGSGAIYNTEGTSPFELENESGEPVWVRVPLDQIFSSQKAALKLFNLLRMDDRRSVKLDPSFAMEHPELCDDKSIIASGIDCTLPDQKLVIPLPKPLTREAIVNYKLMIWKASV